MTTPANASNDIDLTDIDMNAVKNTFLTCAQVAADITLPIFRNLPPVVNKLKSGFDPVTAADRDAETAIRNVIQTNHPTHNIVGEEHDNIQNGSAYTWTIDPIDGTRAFISGVPVWGTLIGLSHNGKNFAGIMSQPFTGETYIAVGGKSHLLHASGDSILKTSAIHQLEQAKLFTTTPALFAGARAEKYKKVEDAVMLPRYGCDCYAYCLLAAGHVDLVIECDLNSYDIAALIPIIEQAGGVVTNTQGGPADQGGDIIAAANRTLHEQAISLYNS